MQKFSQTRSPPGSTSGFDACNVTGSVDSGSCLVRLCELMDRDEEHARTSVTALSEKMRKQPNCHAVSRTEPGANSARVTEHDHTQ